MNEISPWSQHAVIDLSLDSAKAAIYLSTTAKEWAIVDAQPKKIRLIYMSDDGATAAVVVSGKYGVLPK